jgi:MacB-like periplasmic core domain
VVIEGETSLRSSLVSENYFSSVGIVPARGRLLNARDAQPGAPPAAVLGYDYWQSHWAADRRVVGRFVHVNNHLLQIVGVLPYSFDGLSFRRPAVWFPSRFARFSFQAALLSSRIFHARPICFSAS